MVIKHNGKKRMSDKCWFCRNGEGQLILEPEYDSYIHIDCLIANLNKGSDEAEIMAFGLGYKAFMTRSQEGDLITKAQRIYYDPNLTRHDAIELGMLAQDDLIHGEFYVGFSKNCTRGIWDESERCFHCLHKVYYKAGYFCKGRFEDQFIPIL